MRQRIGTYKVRGLSSTDATKQCYPSQVVLADPALQFYNLGFYFIHQPTVSLVIWIDFKASPTGKLLKLKDISSFEKVRPRNSQIRVKYGHSLCHYLTNT